MSQFIIREKMFGYDDEVYYVSGHRIAKVFDNREQAEQTYKQLELSAARIFALYECSSLFNADEAERKLYDDFVYSRCGQHILDESGDPICDVLPKQLNEEDTLAFIQLANMQSYQLLEFADEPKFHLIWIKTTQKWLTSYDEDGESLIYEQSAEALKNKMDSLFDYFEAKDLVQQGSLEQITDSPSLLNATLIANFGLKYVNNQLHIEKWNTDALFAVNPLLKNPLFEIKQVPWQEVEQIFKQLDGYDEYDEDGEA